jgi:hypothetical protein
MVILFYYMKMNEVKKIINKQLIKAILFLVVVTSSIIQVFAQDISFIANAPRVVRAGEQVHLEYSVNQDVDEFTPPDFGEFRYLGGPSTGSSTSIQYVNGKTTKTSSYSFSYYIQSPNTPGKYHLNPATAIYKKSQVQSNSLDIEVIGQSGNTATTSGANTSQNPQNQDDVASSDEVFVRLETDKKTAYVGEQIIAWVKLYSKVGISRIDDQFKGPNYVGFYKQDVAIPQLNSLDREKVGNDIYYTGVLRKVILYPQKNGDIVIEPFDVLVEVQKQSKRQSRSIFDDFFGSSYERARVNLQSKPLRLNIKSLPGNQPSDFSGAVGKFDIYASVNKTEAKTNDAITFKAKITGKGNIKLIEELKTNFPADFDAFEPVVKTSIDDGTYGTTGSKTFEFTIIPRHAGQFNISPFGFTYFDLASGTYKTLTTQAFQLIIAKGDVDSNTVVVSNLSKEDVKMLGVDIRYIETSTIIRRKNEFIFGSLWFNLTYILITVAFIATLWIRWDRIRKSSDVARAKTKKAGKVAGKRLKSARKALKNGQQELFYDEIGKALLGYLSDKLNIPVSELTNERAKEELNDRLVDKLLIEKFFSLTELCEYTRFAPGTKESDMTHIMDEAEAIIDKFEENIRK